jgi:hypothetical protein
MKTLIRHESHLYTAQISGERIRLEVENLPDGFTAVSYPTLMEWTHLTAKLIKSGATVI